MRAYSAAAEIDRRLDPSVRETIVRRFKEIGPASSPCLLIFF